MILLHHGLGSVASWKAQIPAFCNAGYRVVVYDRWGYGRSDSRQALSLPHFEEDVTDLLALLDHLELGQASLVGHSDGGTIALYFAARYPVRTKHLVVVAAHIYIEPKMGAGIQAVQDAFQRDGRFREGLRRLHGDKTDHLFKSWYEGWINERSLSWDMRPILKEISCPAFIIQGSLDEHATPQHAADLADGLGQARLWMEPGSAHMLAQEIPEKFNREVLSFLEEEMEGKAKCSTKS